MCYYSSHVLYEMAFAGTHNALSHSCIVTYNWFDWYSYMGYNIVLHDSTIQRCGCEEVRV